MEQVLEVPFTPPPGFPPKLGTAQVVQDGVALVFTTYDYAVGACDASVWFDSDEGQSRFTLTG